MKHILIFQIILIIFFNATGQDRDCWPLFRGDPELRGTSYVNLPDKPKLLWSTSLEDGTKSPVVVCDGKIVAGSLNGFVYVLNLKGEILWKFDTGNSIEAPALIYNNVVYIGNLEGVLHAIDLKTGIKIWHYKTEGQIMGSPNIHRQGSSISLVTGSYDYCLHCVDAKTGVFKWKYESDNFINGAAAITGGVAIFGGCDGFLHLVNINTGKLSNKIDIATYIASSAATGSGFAYVGDYDGQFTCVNLRENKIAWQFSSEGSQLPFIGSPALFKDYVVAGGRDKNVYCFNKSSGALIWKFNTGSRVDASLVIVSDRVLVVNMRGDFIILNLSDGKLLWTYELGTPVSGNPAVLDKKIIIAADDGNIYCFGE